MKQPEASMPKEHRRRRKLGTGISASQGSNTVPTRWAPALQLRSIHGLSKDHANWIPTLQPHVILGSNTVSSRRAPIRRLHRSTNDKEKKLIYLGIIVSDNNTKKRIDL